MSIAGHDFSLDGKCSCGRKFADISIAEKSDIGKPLHCHSGNLTEREYYEIDKERDRIWYALYGVASGSGPPPSPQPVYNEIPLHDDSYVG